MRLLRGDLKCTRLFSIIFLYCLVTALLIFGALQVIVLSSQDYSVTSQIDIRMAESTNPGHVEELSDALSKVAEQVDKLEGVLLRFQNETKAATEKIGRRSNLEQVIDGVAQEVKALRAERPMNLYLGGSIIMCWVDFFQQYFYLDSRDRGLTPHLCQGTVWDSKISESVERIVRPGQLVVDVGACVGWYAAIFADAVGEAGKVLAVEANPRLSDLLARSMEDHPQVQVVNKAVGSEDKKQVFVENEMTWSPGNRVLQEAGGGAVPVEYTTLDTLLRKEGWDHVDVIKIDVEGHEWQVWEGMQKTLLENPKVELLLEINIQRDRANGVDSERFYEALQSRFKDLFIIKPDDGLLMKTSPSELLDSFGNINLYLKS
ncbi:hypothetical protein KFL_001880080 [Klebsormidium nitens]|uniref:Methyltransferase FkbM domain-containing protein n=1 Tax=Klebsormidium nitens TaxID=105231 RepID=A0A1Y1I0H4_KLENI|nr:hypothetical protein KFL_001880080 [Klebsormidium nitens]|eukprot:GAQ84414.1 hypothetical protein KFL_001880080 [Klebsormidium nitens]